MPSDDFHVTLKGLTGEEIAEYAQFALPCEKCHVPQEARCKNTVGNQRVCNARFTEGVRALGQLAEKAVKQDLEWAHRWMRTIEGVKR